MASNGYASGPHGHAPNAPLGPAPLEPGKGKFKENGREYGLWRRGRYLFPIDEAEMDRLDAMHKFFLVARRYHLWSPRIDLNWPRLKVLDLGCGTGIWVLDVAKKIWKGTLDDSEIKGVDLSTDIQAQLIYSNTSFSAMDIEEEWPPNIVGENSQHLIHMRMLAGSVYSWLFVYRQIFRHLIPGTGYVEHVEIDWEARNEEGPVSPRFKQWTADFLNALEREGRPTRVDSLQIPQLLRETGFVDPRHEVIRVYVNGGSLEPYEIDVGRWFNLCIHKGFMALSLAPLCRGKDPSSIERLKILEQEVLEEIGNRNNRTYVNLHIWTARRPA